MFDFGQKKLNQYKEYVAKRLLATVPILRKAVKGDFTGKIEIPEKEDEFTELLVGLDLIINQFKERIVNLESEQAFTKNIIWTMPVSLVVANPDATIKSVNPGACEILGYQEKELVGQSIEKVFGAAAEAIFRGAGLEKLIKVGITKDQEMVYLTKKGEEIPVATSTSVVCGEKGKLEYIIIVTKDMREILRLEEEKRKTEVTAIAAAEKEKRELAERMMERLKNEVKEKTQEIKEAEKLRERFMADAAHELRTPLTVLQTNLDLLSQLPKSKNPSFYEDLEDLIESSMNRTKHLAVIIEELLLLSKGKKPEELKETIKLKTISEETVEELQPLADTKNINCQVKILNQDLEVIGDETMLRKVIRNLVSNAIKYGREKGKIKIILVKQEGEAKLEVLDNGVGIPKEDLPHIFERFYRVKRKRPKEREGVGLGLAICKWIVELHGGRIEVESKCGKGSKFKLFLPLKESWEARTDFWGYKLRKRLEK